VSGGRGGVSSFFFDTNRYSTLHYGVVKFNTVLAFGERLQSSSKLQRYLAATVLGWFEERAPSRSKVQHSLTVPVLVWVAVWTN